MEIIYFFFKVHSLSNKIIKEEMIICLHIFFNVHVLVTS